MEVELKLRDYSRRTYESYVRCVKEYFDFKKEKFGELDIFSIKSFLAEKQVSGYSAQTLNLYQNAIKFFYREVLGNDQIVKIQFSKRVKKLPVVLTKKEIRLVFNTVSNLKHKLILMLAYGSGLKVSEIVDLRVKDIDFKKKKICVKEARGTNKRFTVLPRSIVSDLKLFTEGKSKNDFVFVSGKGGSMTVRGVQKVFESIVKKLNFEKKVSLNCLRHSFAVHLLEQGIGVKYIQELLGHKNIRNTRKYLELVGKVELRSPLDNE